MNFSRHAPLIAAAMSAGVPWSDPNLLSRYQAATDPGGIRANLFEPISHCAGLVMLVNNRICGGTLPRVPGCFLTGVCEAFGEAWATQVIEHLDGSLGTSHQILRELYRAYFTQVDGALTERIEGILDHYL